MTLMHKSSRHRNRNSISFTTTQSMTIIGKIVDHLFETFDFISRVLTTVYNHRLLLLLLLLLFIYIRSALHQFPSLSLAKLFLLKFERLLWRLEFLRVRPRRYFSFVFYL